MLREHYLFITIIGLFVLLTIGLTITGLKEVTGYSVKVASCEPMTCAKRGLEPTGNYYCDQDKCYRDCIQEGVIIKSATFCSNEWLSYEKIQTK